MDPSSHGKSLFLVHSPISSLKNAAPQDESCELTTEQLLGRAHTISQYYVPPPPSPTPGACTVTRHCVSPPPPPPCPNSNSVKRRSAFCIRTIQGSESIFSHSVAKDVADLWDKLFCEKNGADVIVYTDDGGSFLAHSIVLTGASPAFLSLMERQHGKKRIISRLRVGGVPLDAASLFIRLMYASRYNDAEMQKYVLHLLMLSHVYRVPFIKSLCTKKLEQGLLAIDNVVDVFQLARLCDVPRLSLMCFRLIIDDFKRVAQTEGWRVMTESNPSLEQELVEAVIDADSKKQEKACRLEEDKVYGQLRDAMEALVHICKDGCRTIGPYDKGFDGKELGPCKYPACKGLESLVRHFASCRVKVPGGCVHCKRMWQLLELHSRMCQEVESCRVPLCRHFQEKVSQQRKKEEMKWKLLVTKVMMAKRKPVAFSLATVLARLEEE